MDVRLPKLSVLEVTCKIRADPALAWVPVIAFTSLERWDDDGRAFKLGCGAYISKPFRQRDPLGAIMRYPRSHLFSARYGTSSLSAPDPVPPKREERGMAGDREEIQAVGDLRRIEALLASISLIFWGCETRTVAQQRSAQTASSLRQHG